MFKIRFTKDIVMFRISTLNSHRVLASITEKKCPYISHCKDFFIRQIYSFFFVLFCFCPRKINRVLKRMRSVAFIVFYSMIFYVTFLYINTFFTNKLASNVCKAPHINNCPGIIL